MLELCKLLCLRFVRLRKKGVFMEMLKTYQKKYSDSYLLSMPKKDLISMIRVYENTINNLCDEIELYKRRLSALFHYSFKQFSEEEIKKALGD